MLYACLSQVRLTLTSAACYSIRNVEICLCNEQMKLWCLLLLLQALLEVVNDLFEEQTDLEKIVRKIMQRALTLLQCERCSVLLLEDIDSPVRPFFSHFLTDSSAA